MALRKDIEDLLSGLLPTLGLNKSEAAVFTYLLQTGTPQRVTEIAKKSKTNRTTLYGILKSLSERGLVSSSKEKGTLAYSSIKPHLLVDYIERVKDKLSADAKKIKEAVPMINRVRNQDLRSYPSIQFFEGFEGIKQAYEDTLTNNPSKIIYGFTGTEAVYRVMDSQWIERYLTRRTKKGVMWYDIATDTPASRKMKRRDSTESRLTKLLPLGYDFDIELGMYENKVLIVSYAEDYPVALIIEDAKIAELMKVLFRYVDNSLSV